MQPVLNNLLTDVPAELRTPEMCLQAVKRNGFALQHVPEHMKTPQLCLQAVNRQSKGLYKRWSLSLSLPSENHNK